MHRSPEPVNLVGGLCSPVTYIAWDSVGAGGLPTHQHRRKTEGGGWRRKEGAMGWIDMSHICVSNGETLPLPLPCPLLSVTLPRRQLFPLLGDDVGLKSGAPATQKARFGQNRVWGGASVKRKRSHRTPVYWRGRKRRGCREEEGGWEDWVEYEKRSLCLYVWHLRWAIPADTCFPRTCGQTRQVLDGCTSFLTTFAFGIGKM